MIEILGSAKRKLKCKYIPTGGAFHTQLMFNASEKLKSELDALDIQSLNIPSIAVISNVNAKAHLNVSKVNELLCKQVCNAVLWHQSTLECLEEYCIYEFVQIGTNAKLFSDLIQQTCDSFGKKNEIRFCSFDKIEDGWIIKE